MSTYYGPYRGSISLSRGIGGNNVTKLYGDICGTGGLFQSGLDLWMKNDEITPSGFNDGYHPIVNVTRIYTNALCTTSYTPAISNGWLYSFTGDYSFRVNISGLIYDVFAC